MKLPLPKTRAAIYARSATASAAVAIDEQITSCRQYAQRHGWVEAGVYVDAARSGSAMIGHDGFFNMRAAAERGEFAVVVVEDLVRLSRDPRIVHDVIEELEAIGVIVCIADSEVVTSRELAAQFALNNQLADQQTEKAARVCVVGSRLREIPPRRPRSSAASSKPMLRV